MATGGEGVEEQTPPSILIDLSQSPVKCHIFASLMIVEDKEEGTMISVGNTGLSGK